jgi:hypothetical protein
VAPNGSDPDRADRAAVILPLVSLDPRTESPHDAAGAAPASEASAIARPLPVPTRLLADTVARFARPLDLDQLADHFTGRGPWKKRLPEMVDSLAALVRVRVDRSAARVVLHG